MGKTILLKGVQVEDFCNYSKPSMYLATCYCDWKCCKGNPTICQNSPLSKAEIHEFYIDTLISAYKSNPIPKAIVIGGLEPILQIVEVLDLITAFRSSGINDDIVVYTGYTEDEVSRIPMWTKLRQSNVIIKYGRFILNDTPRYDEVLGVTLASQNQYAVRY